LCKFYKFSYNEGRTKEIAKEMSFRDIGAIIKKAKLDGNAKKGILRMKNPSKAFKLFSEGKIPSQVYA